MKGINCEHSLSGLYARIGYRHGGNCSGGTRRCWIKQQHLELRLGNSIFAALSWKNQWGKCSTADCLKISHRISWAQHNLTRKRGKKKTVLSLPHHRKLNSHFILNSSGRQKWQLMRFVSRLMTLLNAVRRSPGSLLMNTVCNSVHRCEFLPSAAQPRSSVALGGDLRAMEFLARTT